MKTPKTPKKKQTIEQEIKQIEKETTQLNQEIQKLDKEIAKLTKELNTPTSDKPKKQKTTQKFVAPLPAL
jgi:uncharacterized protein YlxW (UPF0749 family)